MSGILYGSGKTIDQIFDVEQIGTSAPHYRYKTSCRDLSEHPRLDIDGYKLVQRLFDRITQNLRNAQRLKTSTSSSQNWRFKALDGEYDSKSPEVQLEREIVRANPVDWANQVPTSSGLVDHRRDKVRNIDLVTRVAPAEFELIELKVKSNTPFFAAMEILGYGIVYLVSRCHLGELQYHRKHMGWELLNADNIHLKVLAPREFYADNRVDYNLGWLEQLINDGLKRFVQTREELSLRLDFQFESFPPETFPADFRWTRDEIRGVDLIAAMRDRKPVYRRQTLTESQ